MEHRWGRRVRTDLSVRLFAAPASAGCGQLRNISISGGFIETRVTLPLLSILRMMADSPQLPPGEAGPVHAIVVRLDADGLGVEWFDGNSEIIATLIEEATERRVQAQRPATWVDLPHRL